LVQQGGALVILHLKDACPYFFEVLDGSRQEPAKPPPSLLTRLLRRYALPL